MSLRLRLLADGFARAASVPLAVLIVVYRALDGLIGPVVRPALAALAGLRLFARLGAALAALPPYVLLWLLAVPFVIIEPLKAGSLYWMAVGHPFKGAAALVVCHALSLVTTERLFHVARPKLMTIAWFARGYGFMAHLGERAGLWLRATAAWRLSRSVADGVARIVRRFQRA